jgi:formate hydrogenlyase subunit 3/multisubunit Na+/H+ antiporter MnhD subunit
MIMIDFRLLILMPMLIGVALFILPEAMKALKGLIALLISGFTLYLSLKMFGCETGIFEMQCTVFPDLTKSLVMNVDGLSKLIVLFIGIFGFLYALYSLAYVTKEKKLISYYSYYLITIGASFGAALSDNLIAFVFFWGLLGLTLYKLIRSHDDASSSAAKKTLVLIGASDSILIMGIGMLYFLSGSYNMSSINLVTNNSLVNIAFLCLLVASFTKAGALPFHTWVPDYVQNAPASSSAFLPASLDKLLGIYFLARICINLFDLTSWATLMLLIVGGITIIAAVMMALIQHNFKKLLGYHAVSQVGYMITGLALGTPLGIAAGLFHMINHAMYKGGLFLTAGSVEKQTGKEDLDDLGGLSRLMPITFFCALIFAFSISGIPPFNGFYSKWMIYRGIIDFGTGSGIANKLWMVWLMLAIVGSALTLASFVKLIAGTYLGRRNKEFSKVKEVSFLMWLPQILLALACVVFGVFAAKWVIPTLFKIQAIGDTAELTGMWQSQPVSILILVSIIVGFLIYWIGTLKTSRKSDSFIGGEKLQDELNYSPLEFYKTIGSFKFFNFFYDKARKKWFDIYNVGKGIVLGFNTIFSACHTGILSTYIMWVVVGVAVLLIVLI